MIYRARIVALLALAIGCAGTPDSPAPGRARVFGTLRLVPHEGAPHASAGGGSYGSRRMRDTVLVDYSTPGFAVVYLDENAQPGGTAQVSVRDTLVEPRFEPANLAIGVGGQIVLENTSAASHIVSYPAARLVKRIEPGGRLEIQVAQAGEQGLFLLDVPNTTATLFAAPGRYAVVSSSGAFELEDLSPGQLEVRAWHPRFPPVARRVQLAPDSSQQVDFAMGVGIGPDGEPEAAAR